MNSERKNPLPESQPTCAWSELVIARFLDGDPQLHAPDESDASGSESELHRHLASCPICARSLEDARRIDGLVAAAAGTRIRPERSRVRPKCPATAICRAAQTRACES